MKERPVLFNGPMVRAILDGSKTQMRRIIKPQPAMALAVSELPSHVGEWFDEVGTYWQCPCGTPGGRLWVRETWGKGWTYAAEYPCVFYKADGLGFIGDEDRPVRMVAAGKFGISSGEGYARAPQDMKWHSPTHMSRWASRITLEVTGVRVERLQDIREEDAIAEGFGPFWEDGNQGPCPDCRGLGTHGALSSNLGLMEVDCTTCDTARKRFKLTWQSIYGAESWDASHWVWVVEFQRAGGE